MFSIKNRIGQPGIIFLLVSLFSLSTCTKFGKNVYVDGRVYNPITGEGIAGVPVKIYRSKIDSKDPLGSDSKTLKTVTTDENGYYKLEYLASPFNQAFVQVNYAGYYPLGWVDNGSLGSNGIKKGKRNHLDYKLLPYGNLQININNTACFDSNDELKIFRTHSLPGFYDNVPNPAIYTGCVNQTGNINKAPMGWYKYSGTVTKNGVVTSKKDSLYLNEGETKIWNISY